MKLASACLQCRSGKRKCDKPLAGTSCNQCVARSLHCSSRRAKLPHHTTLLPQPLTTSESETSFLPSKSDILDLVDLYIYFIHDKPHSLFHEPSLRQAATSGTLSETIIFAILGLSARFSAKSNLRLQGQAFSDRARMLLKSDLENVCLENIQACILVGNLCFAESNANSEAIYFVIANRMSQLLNISDEVPTDDLILREVKRRVWWSLYLIDRWSSAGLGLERQFHGGVSAPRQPVDELVFSHLVAGENKENPDTWQPGIWSHMCTLVKIFGHIQDLNKELAVITYWDEASIELKVLALAEELSGFERDLPLTMAPNVENLRVQEQRGLGRTFVALHLGYHHYATLLYYQYLDHRRPITSNTKLFTERCKYHATMFCELIQMSNQHPHCEALYNIVGHMTVVSSSVLLHTLLLGEDSELSMARKRLELNFEHLIRLRALWPSVGLMMKRLTTFQNNCLKTAQLGTHQFDKWMVKFLLQHTLALDDNLDGDDLSEASVFSSNVEEERLRERHKVTRSIIRTPQSMFDADA